MATNNPKRPTHLQIAKANAVLTGIASIPGFTGDADINPTKFNAAAQAATTKGQTESAAQIALNTARDEAVAAQWAFYNMALRVDEMVVGQFGSDSNEAQAIGRKKKSERKKPARKVNP